ncbi:MAG: NfeD family protein [Prevotellaceae bacterium]|nr:NfeD family protein [Prevotella sp.]MDD7257105.1 NfeD family protein [Prevotellaceae bacterium]MDY6130474.1 NfeD family protein [Prevotella sp.]
MIHYFAENLWQLWALLAVICLVLELTSGDFFIMCFSIGAVCSAVASVFGLSFYGGLAVFSVTSILSLFFVRPSVVKYLHRNEDRRLSNADALIGREGKVSESIEAAGYGRVAIDGDDWKAVSVDGIHINKGEKVRVVELNSIIVTVEKV